MLLRDLYKYRTPPGREQREVWLSACLSEVLDLDRQLLSAILGKLGVAVEGKVTVEHQRTLGGGGARQIADVYIEGDAHRVIVECKDGDMPKLKQMEGYAKLDPGAVIVLAAGNQAIEKHTAGKSWEPFKKLSWQAIYELAIPAPDDPLVNWLRRAFRELLEWANLAPVADVQPADVRALLRHWEQTSVRQQELKAAVAALQPAAMAVGPERWQFHELSAWWMVGRATAGMEVRGLGLNAEVTPRGSLDWSLDLRPTSAGPSDKMLEKSGFTDQQMDKWWRVHLFRGRADGQWENELCEAVAAGRAVLKALGLKRGKTTTTTGLTPISNVVGYDGNTRRTNMEIVRAARAVRATLAERMGGTLGTRYAKLLDGDTEAGWFWVDTSDAGYVRGYFGWGIPANKVKYPVVAKWWRSVCQDFPGVKLDQHPEWFSARFSVDLRRVALREGCEDLVAAAVRLATERRTELFSAKG